MADDETHESDPGDLGRRVALRRRQLGLSVDDLAGLTGMAPDYLRRVEEDRGAVLRSTALARLAAALETTVIDLLGSGHDRPPGGMAGPTPTLLELPEAECWRLLAHGGVGRLVFDAERGPVAQPVNFRVGTSGQVVFRTEPGSRFSGLGQGAHVGFEVDRIDEAFSEGWSVLVTGRLRGPAAGAELTELQDLGVEPWAGGDRSAYFVIEVAEVTGRRVASDR